MMRHDVEPRWPCRHPCSSHRPTDGPPPGLPSESVRKARMRAPELADVVARPRARMCVTTSTHRACHLFGFVGVCVCLSVCLSVCLLGRGWECRGVKKGALIFASPPHPTCSLRGLCGLCGDVCVCVWPPGPRAAVPQRHACRHGRLRHSDRR